MATAHANFKARMRSSGSRFHQIMAAVAEAKIDALPYFDRGYEEPGVREAVRQSVRLVYSI